MSDYRIRTKKSWQQHMPQKPRRVKRGYYSRDIKLRRRRISQIILTILAVLLLQSIFQIPYLRVDKLELIDNKDLGQEEIFDILRLQMTASRYFIFKNNNFFLLRTAPLEQTLLEKYNLDSVTVKKRWPDTLEISLTEKISQFILRRVDTLYLLDAKGGLNRQISAVDDKYLLLEDTRANDRNSRALLTADEVAIINEIYLSWQDIIGSKLILKKITLNNAWRQLDLTTNIGFYVKIDPVEDIRDQLANLNEVLEDSNVNGIDIDYVDIRFGDRVYFK